MKKIKHPRKTDRDLRNEARAEIVEAANRHRRAVSNDSTPRYTMRRLNEAVCVVRRSRLVKPAVLIAAGFRAKEV